MTRTLSGNPALVNVFVQPATEAALLVACDPTFRSRPTGSKVPLGNRTTSLAWAPFPLSLAPSSPAPAAFPMPPVTDKKSNAVIESAATEVLLIV